MTPTDRLIAYITVKLEERRIIIDACDGLQCVTLETKMNQAGIPRHFAMMFRDVEDEADKRKIASA